MNMGPLTSVSQEKDLVKELSWIHGQLLRAVGTWTDLGKTREVQHFNSMVMVASDVLSLVCRCWDESDDIDCNSFLVFDLARSRFGFSSSLLYKKIYYLFLCLVQYNNL
jgi:hypothetical protein